MDASYLVTSFAVEFVKELNGVGLMSRPLISPIRSFVVQLPLGSCHWSEKRGPCWAAGD